MKSFVDETGQYNKRSNIIAARNCYIINGLRCDPSFMDLSFVAGHRYIASYLDVPLLSPTGYVLGSYCVLENKLQHFENDGIL